MKTLNDLQFGIDYSSTHIKIGQWEVCYFRNEFSNYETFVTNGTLRLGLDDIVPEPEVLAVLIESKPRTVREMIADAAEKLGRMAAIGE